MLAFHHALPVVDLVAGTVLFRRDFLARRRRGHLDLPRAIEGGLDLVGFTVATRHPDLRGSLSTPHFWSLGLPVHRLRTNMALAEALIGRIGGWTAASAGRLRAVRTASDVELAARTPEVLGAFIGVQGGHVLDGDVANVERLHALGVRMLAPAHVMDNDLVGSNTGRVAGGLSGLGREVIAELERAGVIVDLAHMSSTGMRETVPRLRRPFVLSHTGLQALHGRLGRRRYSPGRRNVSDDDLRLVAEAGGVVGLTLSTTLLGGSDLESVVRAVRHAVEVCGPEQVALGSDFDGALRMVIDVRGLPALSAALLAAGFGRETVAAVMGGNAIRLLRRSLSPGPAA